MRPAALLVLLISLAGLAGCAMEWSKPGASHQEMDSDQLGCEQAALEAYPVEHSGPLAYRAPVPSKLGTSCVQQSGFNNCDPAGGASAASADARDDANDYNRKAAVRACMTAKGYTYKKTGR